MIPQRPIEVRTTTPERYVDGGQHELLVGVRVKVERDVDVVGERDQCHLEAVRRLASADDQGLDDDSDELNNALEVLPLDAARRVQSKHDVGRGIAALYNEKTLPSLSGYYLVQIIEAFLYVLVINENAC